MAKKKVEQDVRNNPRYHDTRRLLRKYRDETWSLELSVQRLKNEFHMEYGTDIEEFLDTVYIAGADRGGTELEHHAQCIERSHKMLTLLESAVGLLRARHKKGEVYYWVLYYTYMTSQKLKNADEIIEALRPHTQNLSYSTYYRLSKEAVRELSSIFWGFASQDTLKLLDHLLPC